MCHFIERKIQNTYSQLLNQSLPKISTIKHIIYCFIDYGRLHIVAKLRNSWSFFCMLIMLLQIMENII